MKVDSRVAKRGWPSVKTLCFWLILGSFALGVPGANFEWIIEGVLSKWLVYPAVLLGVSLILTYSTDLTQLKFMELFPAMIAVSYWVNYGSAAPYGHDGPLFVVLRIIFTFVWASLTFLLVGLIVKRRAGGLDR